MKKCPYCAEEIQEDSKVCGRCHSDLTVAPTPVLPVQPKMSKKAIASLILGIFSSPYLFPGILGIVFGHLSRKEIRRSAGRLKGARIALAGLILGYGGLFVFINIANFMQVWINHKEVSAVGSLLALNVAAGTYAAAFGGGYPASLAALLPPANQNPDARAARLKIDEVLVSGWKSGYVFTYVPSDRDEKGIPNGYSIRADPVEGKILRLINIGHFGSRGPYSFNHFFTDQTGVIRLENFRPADKNSGAMWSPASRSP